MPDYLKGARERRFRPHIFMPHKLGNPDLIHIEMIADNGMTNWAVARNLDRSELKKFAESARANQRFLYLIRGYKEPGG
ncbi:MAG: hypothetical protein K2V38_23740, partial [Gemmataceae bacterium]|nr:hypothetical protein [Gemmataceae bacterium]